jgi:GDPmannose 4,6-dehydratase
LGITLRWEGTGVNEKGVVAKVEGDKATAVKVGDVMVAIDPRYFRPSEVETLLGDPTKAKEKLGWVPQITLPEMVKEMVAADLSAAQQTALLKQHGYKVSVGRE